MQRFHLNAKQFKFLNHVGCHCVLHQFLSGILQESWNCDASFEYNIISDAQNHHISTTTTKMSMPVTLANDKADVTRPMFLTFIVSNMHIVPIWWCILQPCRCTDEFLFSFSFNCTRNEFNAPVSYCNKNWSLKFTSSSIVDSHDDDGRLITFHRL